MFILPFTSESTALSKITTFYFESLKFQQAHVSKTKTINYLLLISNKSIDDTNELMRGKTIKA